MHKIHIYFSNIHLYLQSEIKAETENNNVDYKPEKSAPISFAIKPKKESTNKPGVLNASKCLQILDDESDNEEENVQPSNDNEDLNDSKMETVNGKFTYRHTADFSAPSVPAQCQIIV